MNVTNSTRALNAPVLQAQPSSPDFRWLESLPYRDFLELGAYDTAPGTARGHLANVLREWSLAEFTDVAVLVATELITNSVRETGKVAWPMQRPPVRLWLRGGPSDLAVLIGDAVLSAPVPRVASKDDENGRGLTIVASLSAAHGYYPAQSGGKVSWAVIVSSLVETFRVVETFRRPSKEKFPQQEIFPPQ